jgi:hypothetical protein
VGWKTLGTFEHNELQILPSTRTANRAQYRLGTSPSSGFTGLGWLSELDCEKYSMRNLRNQVWKDGAIIRDEVALANTWNSTLRSELASAIYGGVCPNR